MARVEEKKFEFLKGDKILWILVILISFFSVFPVYSASSNLQYIVNNGTTTGHMVKHLFFIGFGLAAMRFMEFIKFEYIGKLSTFLLVLSVLLLAYTAFTGSQIEGASASRWFTIPFIGIQFQPSTFTYLMLIIYICRYLTKNIKQPKPLSEHILSLFGPILVVFVLVAKDNGSTAVMIMLVSLAVMALGRFPIKYILGFVVTMVLAAGMFLYVALNTNMMSENRVHTWQSRIEAFTKSQDQDAQKNLSEEDKAKNYQVMQAKAAIVHGGPLGIGPGKSALKTTLPQSVSDFIFAIIVEEYGLIGATVLIGLYFMMMVRIVLIASKMKSFFGSLLVLALGVMIFVQLAVNIAVAVNLIPVTGQPLPLISYGGTSMMVTYIQLGLILNVSSRILTFDEEGFGRKQTIEEINDIA